MCVGGRERKKNIVRECLSDILSNQNKLRNEVERAAAGFFKIENEIARDIICE